MVSIVQQEAPVLRSVAEPVNPKDFGSKSLAKIIADMKKALEQEPDGVAIAAPQIGVPLRIFVVSHRAFTYEDAHGDHRNPDEEAGTTTKTHEDMVFINPVITKLSRKKVWLTEGCLSVRWLYGEVHRADKATVRAYDEQGRAFTRGGSGLMAQIFQHETDHLNGTLFIDTARHLERMSEEEREHITAEARAHNTRHE